MTRPNRNIYRAPAHFTRQERPNNPLSQADSSISPTRQTRARHVLSLIVCAACTYHALACLVTSIPRDSRLYKRFIPPYQTYATLTGTDQYWNMFTSAPSIHKWDAHLEAVDDQGQKHRFGPILPGLKDYDPTFFRYCTQFTRLAQVKNKAYRDAYLERARQEIETSTGIKVAKLQVNIEVRNLKSFADIRKSGELSTLNTQVIGPYFPSKNHPSSSPQERHASVGNP